MTFKEYFSDPKLKNVYETLSKLYEGRDIPSILKKEFPGVIFKLYGPFDGSPKKDFYRLQMVLVPYKERKKGKATKFMQRLIELAKSENVDIFLTPDDSYQEEDGMSKKDLEKWYKKLGFKNTKDSRSTDSMCFYS